MVSNKIKPVVKVKLDTGLKERSHIVSISLKNLKIEFGIAQAPPDQVPTVSSSHPSGSSSIRDYQHLLPRATEAAQRFSTANAEVQSSPIHCMSTSTQTLHPADNARRFSSKVKKLSASTTCQCNGTGNGQYIECRLESSCSGNRFYHLKCVGVDERSYMDIAVRKTFICSVCSAQGNQVGGKCGIDTIIAEWKNVSENSGTVQSRIDQITAQSPGQIPVSAPIDFRIVPHGIRPYWEFPPEPYTRYLISQHIADASNNPDPSSSQPTMKLARQSVSSNNRKTQSATKKISTSGIRRKHFDGPSNRQSMSVALKAMIINGRAESGTDTSGSSGLRPPSYQQYQQISRQEKMRSNSCDKKRPFDECSDASTLGDNSDNELSPPKITPAPGNQMEEVRSSRPHQMDFAKTMYYSNSRKPTHEFPVLPPCPKFPLFDSHPNPPNRPAQSVPPSSEEKQDSTNTQSRLLDQNYCVLILH